MIKYKTPLYHQDIFCFFNEKEYYDWCLKHKTEPCDLSGCAGVQVIHFYTKKNIVYKCNVIVILDNNFSTFCHELSHATFRILQYVGINLENDGANEAYCYLFGEMIGDLYKKVLLKIDSKNDTVK